MTKKLLVVEVPDYIMNVKILGFDKHNDDNGFLECKEITLPSEDEIEEMYPNDDSLNLNQRIVATHKREAVISLINKILNQ